MPKFDLSDAADFSRLTQGTLGNLNSLFGGRDPREWDILEASYNGIKFHVFSLSTDYKGRDADTLTGEQLEARKTVWQAGVGQVNDTGGRRKVKYQFPYRDGQTTDDLGRKPQSFEIEAVIHGPRYREGLNLLLREFDKPTPGKFVHPVHGELDVVVEDWGQRHSHENRKAVELRITFIEHNFTVGDIRKFDDASVKSALSKALAVFKFIDKAISKVEGAQLLARGIKNLIKSYMNTYKGDTARTLSRMNQTFNTKGGSVDIPALLPNNLGGTGIATSASGGVSSGRATNLTSTSSSVVTDENFVVVRSISDPFNGIPVADLNEKTVAAIAVTELTKEVQIIREQAAAIIKAIQANGASLELHDTVVDMRQTIVLIQSVLETGIASSNARIFDYTVPRTMSLREVGFLNGITPDRVMELDLLNPSLLSVNYIEPGTILKVPAA